MNLLAIDTSTDLASVALQVHGEVYHEALPNLRQHAKILLPLIDKMLQANDAGLEQLDGIVFGCGPGSFTGLRIACSVAKALAYAHDLPVFPVSGLAAIANELYHTGLETAHVPVLAMMDARMHEVYWSYYTETEIRTQERVSAAGEVAIPCKPFVLAGVGWEDYVPQLPRQIQACLIKSGVIFPSAVAMIRLVETGQFPATSAAQALPVYLRNQVTQGASNG